LYSPSRREIVNCTIRLENTVLDGVLEFASQTVLLEFQGETVNAAVIVGLAFAPALFWFWFFARRDRNPEPAGLVLRTFVWGGLMVVPAGLLQVFLESIGSSVLGANLGAWFLLLVVGPIEEVSKFIAARSIAKNKAFDEPVDGLIYATAAALGFATLENALYMLQDGASIILIRGPISTLGHVLFALPWGYAMSLKRFSAKNGGHWILRRGLLLGALLHGLFDVFLIGGSTTGFEWLLLPFVPLMVVMWRLANQYYARTRDGFAPEPKAVKLEKRGASEGVSG
jgi:protease PrsW